MGFNIGYAEHAAKRDEIKVGVPGGGAPSQPQAIVECPVARVGGFRLTNQGDTDFDYQLCLRGKTRSVAAEVLSVAVGIASLRGEFANKQLVPGTVVIVEAAAAPETFTDNGDGTLTGDKGGSGTVDYANGTFDVTFAAVSTGNTTADYDTVGWERYAALAAATLAGGGGGRYIELEPGQGDNWADAIKGHTHVGIEAYCALSGEDSLMDVEATHFGDDSEFKLVQPIELGGNLNTTY